MVNLKKTLTSKKSPNILSRTLVQTDLNDKILFSVEVTLNKSFNPYMSYFSHLPNESKEWSSYVATDDDQKYLYNIK